MEPIRVLQVLGGLNRGGAETMIMNLYRAVDKTKVQFDFIIHSPNEDAYASEIEAMGGKIFVFPKYNLKNTCSYKKHWKKFLSEHPEYKVVHSHVRSYAIVFLTVAKKFGLTTVVHSHSTSNGSGAGALVKMIMQRPLRKRVDYLFSCSEESGRWLFGDKAITKDNYRMIPNAVDTEKFLFNEKARIKMRGELGIPDGTVAYCHVGRFHEAKNHPFLLEVFRKILDRGQNAVLLVAGDGDLRAEIEAKIDELGISSSVKLLGSRGDVSDILCAADAFIFPSRWEGLPVTVVEAQASGLTSFVSDTVTRDVNTSHLVKYLPIDSGTELWVDAILNSELKRENVIEQIRAAGFDVHASAEWISEFYIERTAAK